MNSNPIYCFVESGHYRPFNEEVLKSSLVRLSAWLGMKTIRIYKKKKKLKIKSKNVKVWSGTWQGDGPEANLAICGIMIEQLGHVGVHLVTCCVVFCICILYLG